MPMMRHLRRAAVLFAGLALTSAATLRADGPATAPEKEAELMAVLQSDAPAADKAITCKQLAIYGSSKAVPELAKLLSNEQLASWARIPLEVIPGPEADDALRKATDSLDGKLLVGTINSIGVRRDKNAVEPLTVLLNHQDADVATAAAVALGRIGNDAASKSLRHALALSAAAVRSGVAEGCVLCAERFLAEGNAADAVAIYDEVRKGDVPRQRMLEATRGAILARKQDGIPLLVEQFKSEDHGLFQIALSTAREFPGKDVDQSLATELARATPERAALIVQAMADRPETVVLPAVLKAAERGPKPVRLAAIGALGRVGDVSCLTSLLDIAQEADADLTRTAKAALGDLPGDKVDAEIVSRLPKAKGKTYPLLIEVVGQRRIDAIPELLKAVDNTDKTVRSAALIALGETVPLKQLPVLVTQVVKPKYADDAPVAQQALKTACIRMPDREACATELASAVDRTPSVPTKTVLLQILGSMGGPKALQTIGVAAKTTDPVLQDASSRLLGEWMTIDAAPVLLDLAKSGPDDKFQVRAMRGYIRIARQFIMPIEQRAEMCQTAFDACRHPAEKKLVLDVLKRYPTIEMLKMAVKAAQVPELKDDARLATLVIAQKLSSKGTEVRELLAGADLNKVKLEIVKAEYGSGATQKDVTELLQKHATDVPLIALPSENYNESFGGDPAQGSPKQLKIQYRINDKPGEATFAENALIILAMPK